MITIEISDIMLRLELLPQSLALYFEADRVEIEGQLELTHHDRARGSITIDPGNNNDREGIGLIWHWVGTSGAILRADATSIEIALPCGCRATVRNRGFPEALVITSNVRIGEATRYPADLV